MPSRRSDYKGHLRISRVVGTQVWVCTVLKKQIHYIDIPVRTCGCQSKTQSCNIETRILAEHKPRQFSVSTTNCRHEGRATDRHTRTVTQQELQDVEMVMLESIQCKRGLSVDWIHCRAACDQCFHYIQLPDLYRN